MKRILTILVIIGIILSYGISLTIKADDIVKKINENELKLTSGGLNCAVVVRGPGESDIGNTARFAKNVFENSGYNVINKDYPTKYDLELTLTQKIPKNTGQVFLFFICHGYGSGTIKIREGVYLGPDELDDWIDDMEDECNPSIVTILIDACFSGHFIDELSEKNRIVITSTDSNSYCWLEFTGSDFSMPFFRSLDKGKTYEEAWEAADKEIHEEGLDDDERGNLYEQNPQIEDTGNGISVGDEGVDVLPIWDGHSLVRDGKLAGRVHLTDTDVLVEKEKIQQKTKINEPFKNLDLIINKFTKINKFYKRFSSLI